MLLLNSSTLTWPGSNFTKHTKRFIHYSNRHPVREILSQQCIVNHTCMFFVNGCCISVSCSLVANSQTQYKSFWTLCFHNKDMCRNASLLYALCHLVLYTLSGIQWRRIQQTEKDSVYLSQNSVFNVITYTNHL